MLEIKTISRSDRSLLRKFIMLPAKLHRDHKNWVPPIYRDEWNYFDSKKNRAFLYSDHEMLLALKDGQSVGRIMGIINHRHNEAHQMKTSRFSFFECIDNQDIAHVLFDYMETWSKSKGMKSIIGPFGMYYHDPTGFLIEGYEYEPAVATNYNFRYQIRLVENEGFLPETDLVVYRIQLNGELPIIYNKIYERANKRNRFQIVDIPNKKVLKKYIHPIMNLMNECFKNIYGYSTLDQMEIDILGKQYLSFLDTKYVKLVSHKNQIVGFIVAMPNISEGLRNAGGKFFPFGIFKVLKAMKNSSQLDLLIGGIKPRFQGIGIDTILGINMINEARKNGFKIIDSHLELESNYKVRAEMKKLGGKVYKKYRIFKKKLE